MSSNKHAQIRYKVLDDCFSNFRRKYYFEDLLEKCNDALRETYGEEHSGIKTRTLRGDINYMRERAGEFGVEISAEDDGTGFYYRYTEKNFSIFNAGLSENDINQLKETITMLQRFKGAPSLDWMSELIVKFEDKLNLRGASRSVVGYDENEYYTGLDWIQDLFNAIVNKSVLKISYRTFDEKNFDWIIHPYYLKEYNNRWFLFGLNDDEQKITNLALDRIDDIEQVNRSYIPTSIDFDKYFKDIVGVTVRIGKKEDIRLQFSSYRYNYVITKPICEDWHTVDDEKRIIEISVIPNKELDALILSYGRDVEVLSPPFYRARIKRLLGEAYNKYSTVQVDCTEPTDLCGDKQKEPLSE